jgi:hypothetical protein
MDQPHKEEVMKAVVEFEEPVVTPVKKVQIELTPDEARMLKYILNYRSRVSMEIFRATGDSLLSKRILHFTYELWRSLHDQGVHAKDPQ